jgi:hypothetical protein
MGVYLGNPKSASISFLHKVRPLYFLSLLLAHFFFILPQLWFKSMGYNVIEYFLIIYPHYIHSKSYHMFSQYIKNIVMNAFE